MNDRRIRINVVWMTALAIIATACSSGSDGPAVADGPTTSVFSPSPGEDSDTGSPSVDDGDDGDDGATPGPLAEQTDPDGPQGPLAEQTDPDGPQAGGDGGSSPTSGSTDQVSTAPSQPPSSQTLTPSANAPGVTDDEILIGVELLSDPSAATESVGLEAEYASNDESRRIVAAVFDAINRRGGIAGRTAVPLIYFTDVTQGTHASRGQAACSFFTEDNQVFAVVAQGNHSDPFPVCLAGKGIPLIDDANSLPMDDAQLAELAPFVYQPTKLSLSGFNSYIDRLDDAGFFDGGTIGLLRLDRPSHQRTVDNVVIPALERRGLTLEEDFAFSEVQSVGDLSGTSAEASNAVLQFRQAGVDRVLFLPTALVLATIWPPAAESQRYFPLYGLNSDDTPAVWADNASPRQLEGAMAVSWSAASTKGSFSTNEGNPQWDYCHEMMLENGAISAGGWACSPYFFLQEAAANAPDLSPAGLRAGAAHVGTTPYSAKNYKTNFRAGAWDGVSGTLTLGYVADCNCFKSRGGVTPVSPR